MKELSLILIGCGDRGNCYMKYLDLYPGRFKLVAIADPVKIKRDYFRENYNVPEEMCFENYEEVLSKPKFADIVMICTQDKLHFAPAMMAINQKYDLLLEKPVAPTPQECSQIAENAKKNNVRVLVCHVLRYTPFYKTIKKFISEGNLGEVMSIVHIESVGNVHYSHSYTRGNWRNTAESSPMILAKCCHDADMLQWLLDKPCVRVQSVGSLTYFCEQNKPEGAPKRCTDGCPHQDTCFYYAPTLYKLDTTEMNHFRAAVANKFNPSAEEVEECLKTSPYGRCVFQCDNDVVDHQIVTMEFEGEKIATLNMSIGKAGREIRIMGTKGDLRGIASEQRIEFYDFATYETRTIYEPVSDYDESIAGGHGGGDVGIMKDLYDYIALDQPSESISDITVSCENHLICFAAEEARLKGTTVEMKEYIKNLG